MRLQWLGFTGSGMMQKLAGTWSPLTFLFCKARTCATTHFSADSFVYIFAIQKASLSTALEDQETVRCSFDARRRACAAAVCSGLPAVQARTFARCFSGLAAYLARD